jgi:tetratricopeptide (TPR) repeat protein
MSASEVDNSLAIDLYKRAAKLDPTDSAPIRNLSAAYYEVGSYKECIAKAEQSLPMAKASGEDNVAFQVEKLEKRLAKAKLNYYQPSINEQVRARLRILKELPRYHPSM